MAERTHWESVEQHLRRMKHEDRNGDWSTRYFVRFRDWKGKDRTFSAGTTLKGARQEKRRVLTLNDKRVDFEKEKERDVTLSEWGSRYLSIYAKEKRSIADDQRHVRHLCRILGEHTLLSEISLAQVERFKHTRKSETHRGKRISEATIDRSLEVLRHMMRIALEERIIEHVPTVKLYKPQNKRRRVATADEYTKLLAAATPHLQRIIRCCFETGMRSGEIKGLTWAKIDWDEGFIHLAAEDTKERKPKKIPISPTLRTVLQEIRIDQREGKVASISGHVFTWKGKPMKEGWKTAYHGACRRARIVDLRFHDLRHTFVTRKVKEGWDYKRIMAITGHSTFAVFQDYNNPSDEDIKEVVSGVLPRKTVG